VTTATKVVIKPLEDRIVVRPLDAEQTTASGLVIPDTAKEKPQEGEVIAVGPGRFDDAGSKRVPMDVKVGDVVLYSKYGGTEVKYVGEEYIVLSARDVLAIIEKSHSRSNGAGQSRARPRRPGSVGGRRSQPPVVPGQPGAAA
jgi:chaperonin GroES